MSKKWWADGIKFECQGSGRCCLSRGQYGFVYLTPEDRKRFARFFKITTREFTKNYCQKTHGYFHIKQEPDEVACMFLKNKQCTAYEGRPSQCRTWPFWPEVMGAKTWSAEVKGFCPGVGKGKLYSADEIQTILNREIESEKKL